MGRNRADQASDDDNHGDMPTKADPNALGATARPVVNRFAGMFDGACDEHDNAPEGAQFLGGPSGY